MADDDTALMVGTLDDHETRLARLEEHNAGLERRLASLEAAKAHRELLIGSSEVPPERNRFVPWEVREALSFEPTPGIPVLAGTNVVVPLGERLEIQQRLMEEARLEPLHGRPSTTDLPFDERCAEYRERVLASMNSVYLVLRAMAGNHEGVISDTPHRCIRYIVATEFAELRARLDDLEKHNVA